MGHPGGERERSEAAEQHITRRADLLFQVMMVMVVVVMIKMMMMMSCTQSKPELSDFADAKVFI